MRVFFINKSYLPSQTPSGIKKLRKRELESLRGEGTDEDEQRKSSDRIYAYDKYNDLDGEDHETTTEEPYYVPRDEAFSSVKSDDFEKKKLLSAIHGAIPLLMASKDSNLQRQIFLVKGRGIRARQTLAGLNPLSIQLVTEWPLKSKLDPKYGPLESAITNEIVEKQIDRVMTVEEAIKNKKLFIIDYHDLLLPYVKEVRKLEGTTLYGSRTLFFLREDDTLMPIAIELTRPVIDTEPHWRHVFTPSTDATNLWLWRLAKVYVLAHDSGYHQFISHWLRTHCCMEPYIIAANRQLSAMHPIYKLLRPHFRYTMEINAFARQSLINAEGIIESGFFPRRYSMELSSAAYDQLWRFDQEALPADLIRRGMAVEDQTAEHGVKLTIEDYPMKMVFKPMLSFKHGGQKSEQKATETRKTKTAVNFGQYDYAAYFPNRPTIARTNVPIENFAPTEFEKLMRKPEDELLKCFPSQFQAIMVMIVLDMLSTHSPDEEYIGDKLEPVWSEEKQVEAIFNMFKA
ncbi:Lipoxygenase 2 protein, partial [Thalictrum thalictroides]